VIRERRLTGQALLADDSTRSRGQRRSA
jgi:hypothetical protein